MPRDAIPLLALASVVLFGSPSIVRSHPPSSIQFSDVDGAAAASPSGQTVPWVIGLGPNRGVAGTVNIRASWSGVSDDLPYDYGSGFEPPSLIMRPDRDGTAEHPFVGVVTLKFDRPVAVWIQSLGGLRQNAGFTDPAYGFSNLHSNERLEFASADPVTFHGREDVLSKGEIGPKSIVFDPSSAPGLEFDQWNHRQLLPDFWTEGLSDSYVITYTSIYSQDNPLAFDSIFDFRVEGLSIAVIDLGAVPEPGTLTLMAAVLAFGSATRRRR